MSALQTLGVALGTRLFMAAFFAVLLCLLVPWWALRCAWSIAVAPERARKLLVAGDQLGNASLNGEPDETISSRAWRAERSSPLLWGWTRKGIDALFWFEPGHCEAAYFAERERAQLPPEFR